MSLLHLSRRSLLLGTGALALAPRVLAQQQSGQQGQEPPPPAMERSIDAWVDVYGRPTATVRVNGAGPFRFLVDTGSTTTVIAARHAEAMGLVNIGSLTVNGTTGAAEMPMAVAAEITAGAVRRPNVRVALIPEPGLRRWDGMLGADVFRGQRVIFDIEDRSVRLENATTQSVVRPRPNIRLRNGSLAELAGRVGRVSAKLIIDTGADSSIANLPLSEQLRIKHSTLRRAANATVTGVTGVTITGEAIALPRVLLGNVYASDSAAVAADAPIFRTWGLQNEPAMIVGVDLLSRLSSFSIDYRARVFNATPLAMLLSQSSTALG
jgi:predicted aspartyl protease